MFLFCVFTSLSGGGGCSCRSGGEDIISVLQFHVLKKLKVILLSTTKQQTGPEQKCLRLRRHTCFGGLRGLLGRSVRIFWSSFAPPFLHKQKEKDKRKPKDKMKPVEVSVITWREKSPHPVRNHTNKPAAVARSDVIADWLLHLL